jgi:hypothetical protein
VLTTAARAVTAAAPSTWPGQAGPADRQQAAAGSDQHGTDALDHPFFQVNATGSRRGR